MKRTATAVVIALAAAAVTLPALADRGPGRGMMGGMDGSGQMGGLMFERLDADKDGKVTTEEFQAFRASRVEGLDADKDGFVTAEELAAHETRLARERIDARVAMRMQAYDLDGDGRLSAEELAQGPVVRAVPMMFERLDADGDGAVSREEFDAMQTARGDRDGRGERMGHGRDGHGQGFMQRWRN